MKSIFKIIIWLLSAFFLLLSTITIKNAAAQMQQNRVAEDHVKVLDLHFFGFTAKDAHTVFTNLGPTATEMYKHIEQNEDLIYPISYSLFFAINMLFSAMACGMEMKTRVLLMVLPFGVFVADIFENHHIAQLCDQFPTLQAQTVAWASVGNFCKWTFVLLNAIALAALCIAWLIKRSKK